MNIRTFGRLRDVCDANSGASSAPPVARKRLIAHSRWRWYGDTSPPFQARFFNCSLYRQHSLLSACLSVCLPICLSVSLLIEFSPRIVYIPPRHCDDFGYCSFYAGLDGRWRSPFFFEFYCKNNWISNRVGLRWIVAKVSAAGATHFDSKTKKSNRLHLEMNGFDSDSARCNLILFL